MRRPLFLLLLLAACRKPAESTPATAQERQLAPDAAKPRDPTCAARAKALEPFLAALELEEDSHEINFGWEPVTIDRPAIPISHEVDNVTITPRTVSAFDASESDHIDNNIAAGTAPEVANARLAKVFAMKVNPRRGPDDLLRLDVDKAAAWSEVVRVMNAAVAAGYTRVVFAFEATSKLEPPPGVERLTTSADVHRAAEQRLDALRDQCRPWRSARWDAKQTDDPVADANTLAAAEVAGLVECDCAVNLDDVRAARWRAARWHQAHTRTPVEVKLGAGTTIEFPAATPWSEAHTRLLGVTGAVTFVVKGLRSEAGTVRGD